MFQRRPKLGLLAPLLVPLCAALLGAWALPAAAERTQLTVYTALETDQIKAYKDAFEKSNPDV